MVIPDVTVSTEARLVAAACAGDEAAFRSLTAPYLRELHVHCYRMLGSFHDAEDLLQETLLRAWRGLGGFQGRAPVRAWLYRIATNACLNRLKGRSRRPAEALPVPTAEAVALEPYPDFLLEELPDDAPGPEARFDARESVALAFVAAMQLLPARQRSVLLLRDVVGWSAKEVAEALGTSVPAVNSALQRARAALDERAPADGWAPEPPPYKVERGLVRRFLAAWEAGDVDGLAALLTEDAVLTMPPMPMWFRGPAAIADFFASAPAGVPIEQIPLLETRANGEPAVAAYLRDPAGTPRAYGFMVLRIGGDAIAEITGFARADLFPAFALPQSLRTGADGGAAPSSVQAGGS